MIVFVSTCWKSDSSNCGSVTVRCFAAELDGDDNEARGAFVGVLVGVDEGVDFTTVELVDVAVLRNAAVVVRFEIPLN